MTTGADHRRRIGDSSFEGFLVHLATLADDGCELRSIPDRRDGTVFTGVGGHGHVVRFAARLGL
jgi:hypothetical protein